MNSKRLTLIFVNIFWFVVIAFISYRMPLYVDDYVHRMSFVSGEEITSVSMIPTSVREYYMTWGGRAVSMFLIQLMLMLPKWVYAVLNALFYICLVHLETGFLMVARDEKNGEWIRPITMSILFLFTWFFMPDFMEVVTWMTGSITYLWMNVVILGFGYIYYADMFGVGTNVTEKDGKYGALWKKAICVIGLSCFGLCAGWSDESGACTLMVALFLYVVGRIRNKRAISADKWARIIFAIIGFGMLMLAPGNRIRIADAQGQAETGVSLAGILVHRLGRETFYSVLYLTIPIAICAFVYFMNKEGRVTVRDVFNDWLNGGVPFFAFLAFISIYVMTFSAGFADRIFQFPFIMISVGFGIALSGFFKAHINVMWQMRIQRAAWIAIILLMILVLAEVTAGTLYSAQAGTFFDRRMFYYHINDAIIDGLLPGNGIQ